MALSDFLSINFPYGMKKNDQNEWHVYNREYMPLGFNIYDNQIQMNVSHVLYTKFRRLTDKTIFDLLDNNEELIKRNQLQEIIEFWLYSDQSNPKLNEKYWNDYSQKLRTLGAL